MLFTLRFYGSVVRVGLASKSCLHIKKSVNPTTADQEKLVTQLVAIVVGERKDNSKIVTKK